MATVFDPAIHFLADLGVFEILIPFMLAFTLVYAVLQKTQVLGREKDGSSKKNINAMISFTVSFIFVASLQLVSSAVMIAQYSAVAILGMLLLFTVAKLSGHGKWEAFGVRWPIVLAFLIMAVIAITALGVWDWFSLDFAMTAIIPSLIVFAVVLGFIWYITKDTGVHTASSGSSPDSGSSSSSSKPTASETKPAEPSPGMKPAHVLTEDDLKKTGLIWKG